MLFYITSFFKRIVFWFKCARYQSFAQSLLPAVLAFTTILTEESFNLNIIDVGLGLLAIVGVIFAHASANLFDDYFDYTSKAVQKRKEMTDGGIRARSLKCSYLSDDLASVKQLLVVSIFWGLIATCIGGIILLCRGIPILIYYLIGLILAFFYSAPPLKLSYHGLGELVVGLLFGPVLMSGVSIATCGSLPSIIIFLSVPMGILAANILYIHSIMDLEPDKRAGKFTLAALMGTEYRAVTFCGCSLLVCYGIIIVGIVLKFLPISMLLVLVSSPIALELYKSMRSYLTTAEKNNQVTRKFFHGPMECWDRICHAGIDWFMFRWYLARNLMTAFSVCILVSVILSAVL